MIALLATALAAETNATTLELRSPVLESGNTAHTLAQADSKLTAGVFRPIAIRLNDRTDLVTTGVIGSLVAPRVDLKRRLLTQSEEQPLTTSLVVGLNVPTPALGLTGGWLYSESDALPLAVQAKAGVLASRQIERFRLTLGAELKLGVPFGANDYTPRDLWFFDWAMAPISEGPVAAHLKVQGDLLAIKSLLFTVELHLQANGASTEFVSRWFALFAATDHLAIGAGYFTHLDQRHDGYHHLFVPGADVQLRF